MRNVSNCQNNFFRIIKKKLIITLLFCISCKKIYIRKMIDSNRKKIYKNLSTDFKNINNNVYHYNEQESLEQINLAQKIELNDLIRKLEKTKKQLNININLLNKELIKIKEQNDDIINKSQTNLCSSIFCGLKKKKKIQYKNLSDELEYNDIDENDNLYVLKKYKYLEQYHNNLIKNNDNIQKFQFRVKLHLNNKKHYQKEINILNNKMIGRKVVQKIMKNKPNNFNNKKRKSITLTNNNNKSKLTIIITQPME